MEKKNFNWITTKVKDQRYRCNIIEFWWSRLVAVKFLNNQLCEFLCCFVCVYDCAARSKQVFQWAATIAVYLSKHVIAGYRAATSWRRTSLLRHGNVLWKPRHVYPHFVTCLFLFVVSGRPFRLLICPVPSCLWCYVGVLWPNSWMDQGAIWYGSRPWPMPHCVRWEPKRGTAPPNFWPMSVVAKQLDGSRCHLVRR